MKIIVETQFDDCGGEYMENGEVIGNIYENRELMKFK
jgi:glutamate synthase domain-containing protein 3